MTDAAVADKAAEHHHGHRDVTGGWLRPMVFGAMDGLVSNLSLIAGVAAADASDHVVLIAGLAGLLAGAFSMAVGEWTSVNSQRELLTSILEANLSLISVRQNQVVQAISAWAAIIAIPTFFASIWGMNFTHMPELNLEFGYPMALAIMLTATVLLYRFFRRIKWL